MNILQFSNRPVIEITAGTVLSATVADENGTRLHLSEVGQFLYFVELLDPSGCRVGLWSGHSHAEATQQANLLACEFGALVRASTGGAHV